jgi:transcription-repair coupling factor (superfamily II helicase)
MTALTAPTDETLREWTLAGVPKSAEALALAELLEGTHLPAPRAIIHVAVNDRDLTMMEDALAFFAPGAVVLRFPAWDSMPYDRASPRPALMAERMRTLSALAAAASDRPRIVLTTVSAVMQKLPPRDVMRRAMLDVRMGQTVRQNDLVQALLAQGYRRAGKAMEPGEFALRGSIIDIVAPNMSEGVRIDLFGDDIETIRAYDPLTQLSTGKLTEAQFYPVSEVLLSEETGQRFRERYRERFGAVTKEDPLYEAISQGQTYPGMEHWLPLFYDHTDTLFDYAPDALITFDSETPTAMEERRESIRDYYEARIAALTSRSAKTSFASGAIYNPLPPEQSFLMEREWQEKLAPRDSAQFSPFTETTASGHTLQLGYRPVLRFTQGQAERTPFDQLKDSVDAAAARGAATMIACYSSGSRERLTNLLMERGFHCLRIEQWQDKKEIRGRAIGLAVLPLESGFATPEITIYSEQDVLGERIVRARPAKKKSDVFMAEAANFTEGELIVHKEHGIGRFEGLITLTVLGAAHDCLKIIYEGDDKLFLPVENIELVSRFGLEEEDVKLDKLGGASWQARKARLKQRITLAAEELLKIAAERQVKSANILETAPGAYDDFCARFPYAETEDQARSIAEVLEDLHSGKPMDRLICGDVGFGKTEVALRAAFVAASHPEHKMQVAVIAPTTLLARQHYINFHERFKGFPVVIRQLSRMVPAKAQKETREKLAKGEVDIVIGTHALLAKNVEFKNLGLLIVDEEQHFGVAQKEKLKSLRAEVHVLTLSATPIPRTLQMALTGVRDLSLITTPPIDRLAIRSFVMPFDPVVLREAILREMHRGGKTFVVTPRIKHIAEMKAQLTELVPEVRIAVAHGQLAPAALDTIMNEFYDGKYDVLLSTAIIESGLDIPTANTIIIHNAQLLGLAQLYQLRGRVGRAKTRAYAYFLLPHHKLLSKNATRRLEVMQTLDTLGAGFTLASHDMDIRGFGNLVGEEQSGHIREVGIELYQQMLEEAVAALKSGRTDSEPVPVQDWSPQINLGLSVLIPESYVNDLTLRLGLYRRIAGMVTDAEIESFAAELIDRFGPMPEETQHLIAVLGLKLLAKQAGIERIDTGPKGAVLSFRENKFANPEALLTYIGKNARNLKARPDQKLVFTHEWKDSENKIAAMKKLVGEIAGLANK